MTEKKTGEKSKKITMEISGDEISFEVSSADYRRFTNEVTEKNKVTPMCRFLKSTVISKDKETLGKYVELYFVEITAVVMEEYKEELDIHIKK